MSAAFQHQPSDETFMRNVMAARKSGADLVCAFCGCCMDESESKDEWMHEWNCPNRGHDRMQRMLDLLNKRTQRAE